jgi:type 1 fimbriae regulatory protein FimB/type 1 fimbriae regulatory protein FimE
MPSVHPLQGDEMRALRALKRESSFVFVSERGTPFTRAGFAKMVARLGLEAKFKFGVHPHMLRHACGYALALPRLLAHAVQIPCCSDARPELTHQRA